VRGAGRCFKREDVWWIAYSHREKKNANLFKDTCARSEFLGRPRKMTRSAS